MFITLKRDIFSELKLILMIAVITGDIINSKKLNPKKWLKPLKKELDDNWPYPKILGDIPWR